MKKINSLLISIAALLTMSHYTYALNIYISPSGNDSWSGKTMTKSGTEGPVASLNRAMNIALESDPTLANGESIYIMFMKGDYFVYKPITLQTSNQGYFVHPVIIKPYEENSNVTISGSIPLNQLDKFKANFGPIKYDQLFTDDSIVNYKPFPQNGFFSLTGFTNKATGKTVDSNVQSFYFDPAEIGNSVDLNLIKKRNYGMYLYVQWTFCYKKIDSVDLIKHIFYTSGQNNSPFSPWAKGTRFKLIKLAPNISSTSLADLHNLFNIPSSKQIYLPVNDVIFNFSGTENNKIRNVTFSGIQFKNFGYNYSSHTIDPTQAAFGENASFNFSYTENITFNKCRFKNICKNAIWFYKANNSIKINNCTFNNMGAGSVKVGSAGFSNHADLINNNILISNNEITNSGKVIPSATSLFIANGNNITITNNNIIGSEYSAISIGWGYGTVPNILNHVLVSKNRIENIGSGLLDDFGGVYALGTMSDVTVSNNIIKNLKYYHYGAWGIYMDQGSSNVSIINNIVQNCQSTGFMQNKCKNIVVKNNIFANNFRGQVQFGSFKTGISLNFTNNILYQKGNNPTNLNWDADLIQSDYNVYLTPNDNLQTFESTRGGLLKLRSLNKDTHSKHQQINDNGNILSQLNVSNPTYNFKKIDTSGVGYKR